MISEQLNIYEYEELLMGKRNRFECSMQGTQEENCQEAGNIWRYAVLHLLHWTPKEAVEHMNYDIVRMLYLDKTFKAIGFKRTNNYNPDFKYALQYAFPDEECCRMDLNAQAISEYKHVAKLGEWANDTITYKYPKKFFIGENGVKRANYIMRFVVRQYLAGIMSRREMYAFFADRRKAKKWLVGKCLESPVTIIYQSPLDYFHFSQKFNEQDDVLYYIHRINEMYKEKVAEKASEERNARKKGR